MKEKFTLIGIVGIIATVITGLTSFSNNTSDFAVPFIVLGILLSVIIIELGYLFDDLRKK